MGKRRTHTTDKELSDRDHAENVCLEHLLDVRVRDIPYLFAPLNKPGVVDCSHV
jgi:hypothetical protein